MTRRILCATVLLAALGAGVGATTASADDARPGRLCIGWNDRQAPLCVDPPPPFVPQQ